MDKETTELLLILITHKDVYLSLYSSISENIPLFYKFAKPRFIYYEKVCSELLKAMKEVPFQVVYQDHGDLKIPYGLIFGI